TEEHCYGIYGCYEMSHPWSDDVLRPVSYAPQPPELVNPRYCLYTRENRDTCQYLEIENMDSLYRSSMMHHHRVFIISHGFIENGDKEWIKIMKEELLTHIDGSVIVVDWRDGSGPPYPQAVANIRLVGTMTAHLLKNLIVELGIEQHKIHFIGHSLGAHMAAYAGQSLQSKFNYRLGRITGLDPAEPHFSKTDPIVRLDPTDADFVDVIHTDGGPFISGGLGILQPVGHVDFYPNGGIQQPGCDSGVMFYMGREMGSFYKGIRKMISCNHIRSYQYFTESINPNECHFVGTECDSWEHFLNGSCFDCTSSNKCPFQTKLGFHADTYLRKGTEYGSPLRLPPSRSHIKLYMMTGDQSPFCRHHYHIAWKISDSCKSLLHGGEVGMIWVTLHGHNTTSTEIKLSNMVQYYEPGEHYHATVAGSPVGKLKSITLRWEYHTSPWNPLTWRLVTTPRIYVAWMQVNSLEERNRITVCPDEGQPLTSRKPLLLEKTREDMCKVNSLPQQLSDCDQDIH
ncbi:hypothetical protein L9F63_020907, partial [Diploptera punctata]